MCKIRKQIGGYIRLRMVSRSSSVMDDLFGTSSTAISGPSASAVLVAEVPSRLGVPTSKWSFGNCVFDLEALFMVTLFAVDMVDVVVVRCEGTRFMVTKSSLRVELDGASEIREEDVVYAGMAGARLSL